MDATIEAGSEFEVDYPFVRTSFTDWSEDGPSEKLSWKPGVIYEQVGPEGETNAYAHAMGKLTLTVVDTFKPGRYPRRIFFTRKWHPPTGSPFGKTSLQICTEEKFRRLARGYMAHDSYFKFEIDETADPHTSQ